jgi:hypothetical protein
MKVAFTTSKELNGTALLRDKLQELDDDWLAVDSYLKLIYILLTQKKHISSIYCLSDIHCIYAHAVCGFFKIQIPIILGYYHPEQWMGTTDAVFSKTRANAIQKIINTMPSTNIVFSSKQGAVTAHHFLINNCTLKSLFKNIVPGPVVQTFEPSAKIRLRQTETLKILTIGRFVPFKISTILTMIEVVDELVFNGYDISYVMHGDGSEIDVVKKKISESSNPQNFKIGPFVNDDNYAKVCLSHDLFYGMGGAVIRAAMLKIPSLIAIQRCSEPVCYGLVSDHDHYESPVFGDDDPDIVRQDIRSAIINLYNNKNLFEVGIDCFNASHAYSAVYTLEKLNKVMENAIFYNPEISIIDVVRIRFETYLSRFRKINERDL